MLLKWQILWCGSLLAAIIIPFLTGHHKACGEICTLKKFVFSMYVWAGWSANWI